MLNKIRKYLMMYSGNSNNSNNMLYGGPLGTYLSGIYQPISPINHNVPKINRRSSLRTNLSTNNSSGNSSLYYTPQPRRRHENSDKYISPTSSVPSAYRETSSARLRPKSYYNSVQTNSVCSNYNRPSSMVMKNSISSKPSILFNQENIVLDYKKLYEDEKLNNDLRRKEINEIENEINSNNDIIDSKRRCLDQQKILMDNNISTEYELQEVELLKSEGDKLRAENRALARVVARLSREK